MILQKHKKICIVCWKNKMLDELFDPLSRIKMLEMYINDIRIDNKVLNDKLVSIELKFGLFDKWVMGYISCAEDLFTLTIN